MELSGYIYICSAGETFDSIALALWDDENYAADLLCANPEYCTQQVFSGGARARCKCTGGAGRHIHAGTGKGPMEGVSAWRI